MGLLGLSGCGSPSSASTETSSEATSEVTQAAEATQEEQTELVKTGSMELQYAENFAVDTDWFEVNGTLLFDQGGICIYKLTGVCS